MKENNLNNQNGYINEYLIQSFTKLNRPQSEIVKDLKKSQPYVSALMNGKKRVGKEIAKQLSDLYGFDEGSILTGHKLVEGSFSIETSIKPSKENIIKKIPLSNGRLIEKEHFKTVTVIPAKAQLGLQGTMFKEDFIGKLETKIIETEDNWQGRYFDIESAGDSMINLEEPELSIYDGDELRVREIPRDMYINSKLHIHDWREFTFFHYEKNIFTKNILEHDVAGRRVLVHSYNKDFEDEWIDLNDCYIVCNVISVTRPRGFKRRIKNLSK